MADGARVDMEFALIKCKSTSLINCAGIYKMALSGCAIVPFYSIGQKKLSSSLVAATRTVGFQLFLLVLRFSPNE